MNEYQIAYHSHTAVALDQNFRTVTWNCTMCLSDAHSADRLVLEDHHQQTPTTEICDSLFSPV